MKLFKLLKGIKCRVLGSMLVDVVGLSCNDKDIKDSYVYFSINGIKVNGVCYINSAVKNGATVIVTEKEVVGLSGIVQVLVKDVRKTMSLIAKNFYNNPGKDLKIIGVTGTNGKTTTTYMLAGILNCLGLSSAIIGTNGVVYKERVIETGMTTPDPIELYRILRKLVDVGVVFVCMEVSAHAIYFKKIEGLIFDVVIFSNLTEDHLDFFHSMENYFETKRKLFSKIHSRKALINIDDGYGLKLFDSINMNKKSYSIYRKADYVFKNLGVENFMQKFKFRERLFSSKFLGVFNIYNLLSAFACIEELGLRVDDFQGVLNKLNYVPGRFNTFVIKQKLFIIDYAHTPDGLENVLKLCNDMGFGGKLICVFGCGGDRETQKRCKMGEISSKYADFTIITSDNPRYEDRFKIARDIECGVLNNNYKIILDRSDAIKYANEISIDKDVILMAGKGCENYIDECGVKKPYSDFDEIEKLRK